MIDKTLLQPNDEIEYNNIVLKNNQLQLEKMKQNLESEHQILDELKRQNAESNRKIQEQIKLAQQKTTVEIPVAELEKEEAIIENEELLEPEVPGQIEESENLDDEDDFGEEDGEMVNDHLEGLQDLINSLGGPENF